MHILKTSILSGLLLTAAACISCQTSEPCSWKEMEKVYNQISPPTFPDKTYVITDYYNGKDSLYTDAINRPSKPALHKEEEPYSFPTASFSRLLSA